MQTKQQLEDLLYASVRSSGNGDKTTAADVRNVLHALITELYDRTSQNGGGSSTTELGLHFLPGTQRVTAYIDVSRLAGRVSVLQVSNVVDLKFFRNGLDLPTDATDKVVPFAATLGDVLEVEGTADGNGGFVLLTVEA